MNTNQYQPSGYQATPNTNEAKQQYGQQPDQPYQSSQYQGPTASHPSGTSQQQGAPHEGFGPGPNSGTNLAPTVLPHSQQMSGGAINYPPPPPPPRQPQDIYAPPQKAADGALTFPPPPQQPGSYQPSNYSQPAAQGNYAQPPSYGQHTTEGYGDDDPSNPIHYIRDPHKLIAYLVPFPKPQIHGVDPSSIPDRFLIYTPPPPPLSKPAEGEKESKVHKVQRKWQEEVRSAKTSTAKTASWKGVKSKVTKGISHAMDLTKSSNIDFLNRIPGSDKESSPPDPHAHDGVEESDTTHRTVGLSEMILIYPPSLPGPESHVRAEFINSMLRSKSKAQRDAIIASGLLPVSAAIDLLATVVWPFGGLLEIDSVWAYSSIRGAKAARSTRPQSSPQLISEPRRSREGKWRIELASPSTMPPRQGTSPTQKHIVT
ncbi:hypothetical protein LPUS_02367 [Lasallia pustulata]|uniref:Uncharacterized protein n=1 Tax=Lasallia pustulata TaxID=136370 RepID=A0A1W5CSM3_9LECA|nr:hypothetical protein LPUS_02367 [Lasallia pustulata]